MAAKNNTTSLSMGGSKYSAGSVGTRHFSDRTTMDISAQISRGNYRKVVVSDKRMQDFRDAVYSMISGWAIEDKIAILTEYGDSSRLSKKPTEEEINRVLTESLIIHLEPSDLNQLYNDILVNRKRLKIKIKNIEQQQNKKTKKLLSRLNIANFERGFERVQKARTTAQYERARHDFDPTYKVPYDIRNKYNTLRRELRDVLRTCYNKVDLTGLALSMGIEIESSNYNVLLNSIINKTVLYVDLIVGRGRTNYSNAYMNPEPYNNLLSMTSYSYITGKPGMSSSDFARLKKQARLAQAAIRERARMQNPRRMRLWGADFRSLSGGAQALTLRGMANQLNNNDTSVLANLSMDELFELAGKYGIDPTRFKNRNIGILKAKILNGMRNETVRIRRLNRRNNISLGFNRYNRNINDLLDIHKTDGGLSMIRGTGIESSSSSSSTPIVRFSSAGRVISGPIFEAVPVFVIGENDTATSSGVPGPRGKDLLGAKRNKKIDTSVMTKDQLSENEVQILTFFQSLKRAGEDANDINKVKNLLITYYGVKESFLDDVDSVFDGDFQIRKMYYCYAYALAINQRKLAGYLYNNFGTSVPRRNVCHTRARGHALDALRIIRNSFINMINTFAGPKGINLRKFIDHTKEHRGINDISDLTDRSRQIYISLKSANINQLEYSVRKNISSDDEKFLDRIKQTSLNYNNGKDYKLVLIFLYCRMRGLHDIETLIRIELHHAEFSDNDIRRLENIKSFNRFRSILHGARNLFSRHGGHRTPLDAFTNSVEQNLDKGDASNVLPLPIISLSNGEPLSAVNRAVAVYVVNNDSTGRVSSINSKNNSLENWVHWGSGNANRSKNGKQNRVISSVIYNNKFGANLMDENLNFTVTDVSNILSAEGAVGRKAKKNPPVVGEKYQATKAMIKWAVDNNKKFAQGGESFIAGDSLTGKPNPEKVTINGDGTFSVRPLKRGPENAHSQYAIRKYATGGVGSIEGNQLPNITSMVSKNGISLKVKYLNGTLATPVYSVNKNSENENIISAIENVRSTFEDTMGTLMLGLGNFVLAAPMGTGVMTNPTLLAAGTSKKAANAVLSVANTTLSSVKTAIGMNTGGKIVRAATGARISSGFTNAITGDASGRNIFANGAKPELVSSTGNLSITPLNKISTASKQKVSRMTSTERSQALATGISSHIIKFNYNVDGTEVSNIGEAIKVYNVKPGITDKISVSGIETSLIELLGNIYAQLVSISGTTTTNSALLTTIAAKPTSNKSSSASISTNPFAGGFPSTLDSITGGN